MLTKNSESLFYKRLSIIIAILFLVVISIITINSCNNEKPLIAPNQNYQTDSIKNQKYKPDSFVAKIQYETLYYPIKPKTVIKYVDSGKWLSPYYFTTNFKIKPNLPSVTYDSLKSDDIIKTMAIVNMKIAKDSLNVTWVKDDLIYKNTYPLQLGSYNYTLDNYLMYARHTPNKPTNPISIPKIRFGSNLYFLYSPINETGFRTAIDYYVEYRKWGLYGLSSISSNESPHLNTYLGLRYKLK